MEILGVDSLVVFRALCFVLDPCFTNWGATGTKEKGGWRQPEAVSRWSATTSRTSSSRVQATTATSLTSLGKVFPLDSEVLEKSRQEQRADLLKDTECKKLRWEQEESRKYCISYWHCSSASLYIEQCFVSPSNQQHVC